MKLSDAILKGIQRFPKQSKENYFGVVDGEMGACVLGCAIYGEFDCQEGYMIDELVEMHPELMELSPIHKLLADVEDNPTLSDRLSFLNDYTTFSREEIVEWLKENDQ